MNQTELEKLAMQMAEQFGLPPELVCAICKCESNWRPAAYRYEPLFKTRYIDKLSVPGSIAVSAESEKMGRATSWGLMQVMGQVARERGFKGAYLTQLLEPVTNLSFGCRILYDLTHKYHSIEEAISAYNAGSPTDKNKTYVDKVKLEMNAYAERLSVTRNPH